MSDGLTPNPPYPESPRAKRVFISYAWEDDAYREEVRNLAATLRSHGVDVRLDLWHLEGLTIPEFMNREVRHADKILICGSPKYRRNVQLMEDDRPTGSGWEAMLVTSAIWTRQKSRTQFEVVILKGSPDDALPLFLSGWPYIDLTRDYPQNYLALLRRLTDNQEHAPPIGQVPDFPLERRRSGVVSPWAASPAMRLSYPGILRTLLDHLCPRFHDWLRRMGVVTTPREYRVLSDHLMGLQAYLRQEIDQRTYIENIAKRVPRSGPGDESTVGEDPFALPIQRVIRSILGHSQGGDSASAQLAAINRRSRVVRNLLKTLRRSSDPLILLGDPGTGKTLTLQQAALSATKAELRCTYPSVPIYVRVGEFHVSEGEVSEGSVIDYVKRSVREDLRPFIDALDMDGRLIIFFDGLDEMSRQRYTEHTVALSKFAGRHYHSRHAGAKTLFSCRITDFSPTFRHSRLVLLPFSEAQIREYLERSFPGQNSIQIEKEAWRFKSLARHLCATEFLVDASNPFVLYLLCFYLDQKHSWPGSRTELLRFYLEETYRRKQQEHEEDLPFPPHEQAVRDWAAVAYTITSRNLGGAISLGEIATLLNWTEERAQKVGRLGRRCGVLAESVDHTGHLVRLDHHRLQEYLTATHIHAENSEIDWADKIDAPRWQETLVNLVVMGGGYKAIEVLSTVIREPIARERQRWAEYEEREKAYEPPNKVGAQKAESKSGESQKSTEALVPPAMEDAEETVLADRIEVAARICHEAGRKTPVTDKLLPALRDAVDWLTQHGNPITQVKMIRVVMQLPEPEMIEAARRPLRSGVTWLRNQALILLSFTGADLPTEVAEDVAQGQLLPRCSSYIVALKNNRQSGARYNVFVGALCALSEWIAHLATASALYVLTLRTLGSGEIRFGHKSSVLKVFGAFHDKLDWLALPDNYDFPIWAISLAQTMLMQRWMLVGLAAILLAAMLAARKVPERFGPATLASAGLALLIPFWLVGAWYEPTMIFLPIVALTAGSLGFLMICVVWLGVLRCFFVGAYITATFRYHRTEDTYTRFIRRGWMAAAEENFLGVRRWTIVIPLATALWWGFGIEFAEGGAALWAIGFLIVMLPKIAQVGKALFSDFRNTLRASYELLISLPHKMKDLRWWFEFGSTVAIMIMFGATLRALSWLTSNFAVLLARILAMVLGVGLICTLLWTLFLLIKWLRYLASSPYPPGAFTVQEWLEYLQSSVAGAQEEILVRTTHESLSLTPQKFLEVLQAAGAGVKGEPALSTYWRRRAELEQVLRQERRG